MAGTVYGSRIVAHITLQSLSPYSQSRAHDEPPYENESKSDHDRRTWRSHLHVENGTDPIITEQIFREMVAIGGMFKGIGRYRPANRGTKGRYEITDLVWHENRRFAA